MDQLKPYTVDESGVAQRTSRVVIEIFTIRIQGSVHMVEERDFARRSLKLSVAQEKKTVSLAQLSEHVWSSQCSD